MFVRHFLREIQIYLPLAHLPQSKPTRFSCFKNKSTDFTMTEAISTDSLNQNHQNVHPSVFTFLIMPMGIVTGFVSVALAYQFSQAGISIEKIAALVAAALLPHMFKFLWAPLIDSFFTLKKWHWVSNLIAGAGIVAMGLMPIKEANLPILTLLVILVNFAVTFTAMSTESLMAYAVPENLKGRVGGFFQAGNLGGTGLGGGAGLWLAQHLSSPLISGLIVGTATFLCSAGLFFITESKSTLRSEKISETMNNLLKDIWSIFKSRNGLMVMLLCFLPLGTGAASGLWSAVANDWSASADTVAIVTGVLSGFMSAGGCIIGGWICDRMNRRNAYLIFGLVGASIALMMAYSPHTELMYIIWTSVYAIGLGFSYAGFTAAVLETIGTGAAATKYNIYAALSNTPIYLMTYIDGWAHAKWGPTGMLNTEAVVAIIAVIGFTLIQTVVYRKKYKSIPN